MLKNLVCLFLLLGSIPSIIQCRKRVFVRSTAEGDMDFVRSVYKGAESWDEAWKRVQGFAADISGESVDTLAVLLKYKGFPLTDIALLLALKPGAFEAFANVSSVLWILGRSHNVDLEPYRLCSMYCTEHPQSQWNTADTSAIVQELGFFHEIRSTVNTTWFTKELTDEQKALLYRSDVFGKAHKYYKGISSSFDMKAEIMKSLDLLSFTETVDLITSILGKLSTAVSGGGYQAFYESVCTVAPGTIIDSYYIKVPTPDPAPDPKPDDVTTKDPDIIPEVNGGVGFGTLLICVAALLSAFAY